MKIVPQLDRRPPHTAPLRDFDNLDVLAEWLRIVRKVVGPEPKFHILMPSTEICVVNEPITWPKEVFPIVFEGEERNHGGVPYVSLNMLGAAPEIFSCVKNLADEPVIAPPKPSVWKRVASTSAAWGAGVSAAVVATPGGLIVGFVGCAALAPVAIPEMLIAGVVCGSGVAAGAAAGTITRFFVGSKVEEAWDN